MTETTQRARVCITTEVKGETCTSKGYSTGFLYLLNAREREELAAIPPGDRTLDVGDRLRGRNLEGCYHFDMIVTEPADLLMAMPLFDVLHECFRGDRTTTTDIPQASAYLRFSGEAKAEAKTRCLPLEDLRALVPQLARLPVEIQLLSVVPARDGKLIKELWAAYCVRWAGVNPLGYSWDHSPYQMLTTEPPAATVDGYTSLAAFEAAESPGPLVAFDEVTPEPPIKLLQGLPKYEDPSGHLELYNYDHLQQRAREQGGPGTASGLFGDHYYVICMNPDSVNIEFGFFEWVTETEDCEILLAPVWVGRGTGGSLRELRHSWFGPKHDGYIHYAKLSIIRQAMNVLPTYFDVK